MMVRVLSVLLIAAAAFSRLLPHPENFTPLAAIALSGGVYLEKRYSLLIPLAALFLSDIFLGFHATMPYVYGSFLLIGLLGIWLKSHKNLTAITASAIAGSALFFIVTNFAVWFHGTMYPHTVEGLAACYVAAIPFFRNTFAGDLLYTAVMFGVFELLVARFGKPAPEASAR